MKTSLSIFTLLLFFILPFAAQAQKISATESSQKICGSSLNSIVVELPLVETKEAEKGIKSLLKDYKGKIKKEKGDYMAEEMKVEAISNDPVTVYYKVEELKGGGSKVITSWKLSGGYVTSNNTPDQFSEAKKIMEEWGVKISKEQVEDELKATMKIQSDMEKEQGKLEKEQSNLEKSIEDNKKKIEKAQEDIKQAEKDIETNTKEQEIMKKEIERIKKMVEAVKKKLGAIK